MIQTLFFVFTPLFGEDFHPFRRFFFQIGLVQSIPGDYSRNDRLDFQGVMGSHKTETSLFAYMKNASNKKSTLICVPSILGPTSSHTIFVVAINLPETNSSPLN